MKTITRMNKAFASTAGPGPCAGITGKLLFLLLSKKYAHLNGTGRLRIFLNLAFGKTEPKKAANPVAGTSGRIRMQG